MLSRSCLSIWQQCFKFISLQGWGQRSWVLWAGVREELECALALAPMLRVDRSAPLAREVVASDASTYGQGVVYATMEPGDVTELARAREVRGYPTLLIPSEVAYAGPRPLSARAQQAITSQQWRVGVRSRWRDPGMHINEKEVRAAVKGVERSARSLANRGKRVVRLVDSTAALGCLAKGRSSSHKLNKQCRRLCALTLATGSRSQWVWTPSALQPADGVSRGQSMATFLAGWVRDLTAEGIHPNPGPPAPVSYLPLLEGKVKPATLLAYRRGLDSLLTWWEAGGRADGSSSRADTLEETFCAYVAWAHFRGYSRQVCVNALMGLQLYYPGMVKRWDLARGVLAGWKTLVPPRAPPPIPWEAAFALASTMVMQGQRLAGLLVVIVFRHYLRISEALNLRVGHVRLQPDVRLGPAQRGALLLRSTKTSKGKTQSVVVEDVMSETILRHCIAGKHAWEAVFPFTYPQFRRIWQAASQALGVAQIFTIHGLRHGGATHDFLAGRSMGDIQGRGRWLSSSTVAHYVGLHRSLEVQLPEVILRAMAACPPRAWRAILKLPST
eukprot:jgi/Mesvir1/28787/Mv25579-RA.1